MAKRKARPVPKDPADMGPDIRHANGTAELDMRAAFRRSKAKIECKVDYYFVRGYIAQVHHNAGMLFRKRWLAAVSQPNVVARYGDSGGRGIEEWSKARIDAAAAVRGVLDEINRLHGPDYVRIIVRVAGQDETAGPGTMKTLWRALDALAKAWQIGDEIPLELAA